MDITTLPSPAAVKEWRRIQIIEEILQEEEVMTLENNNQLAEALKEDLMKELLSRFLDERGAAAAAEHHAVELSDDAASDQQLKDMVAATKEEKLAAKSKKKKPRKQKKAGGFISLKLIAFRSIVTLIFSLSYIHQIGGSEGQRLAPPAFPPSARLAPPAFPPSASRYLRERQRQREHLSDDDNAASASPEAEVIMSPLPVSIVAPPPILSPAGTSTSNHRRMKFDELRSVSVTTCLDTPNWVDIGGEGCDVYEEMGPGWCGAAEAWAGDMGPATENCCYCGGAGVSLPPINSPTITISPTIGSTPALPSNSSNITIYPTMGSTHDSTSTSPSPTSSPSSSPSNSSISSNPPEFCFDTPNWKDKNGWGCEVYIVYDLCSFAEAWAGNMGPATENCCYCGGAGVSLSPINSPTITISPTKSSATPSTSLTSSSSSSPSVSSISSTPPEFCVDAPNWKDGYGSGCGVYKVYDLCSSADTYAGDMGPATENCCYCGSVSTPSLNPSVSSAPSSEPSAQPSSAPSLNPSVSSAPSSEPSGRPSSAPSLNPSVSSAPSSEPSAQPSSTKSCSDKPNWKDGYGSGCEVYKVYDLCSLADAFAGDMGPATENCCYCGSGIVSLPPANSPNLSSPPPSLAPSLNPSVSSAPSSEPSGRPSSTPSLNPSLSSAPSSEPSAHPSSAPSLNPSVSSAPSSEPSGRPSSSPSLNPSVSSAPSSEPSAQPSSTKSCFDKPNWKDGYGSGCEVYKVYDLCSLADAFAGDMGPATENCCYCGSGIVSLPPTNSPN